MVSAFVFLVVYIVGGLTFIPLCLLAFLALLFYSSPKVDPEVSIRKTGLPDLAGSAEDLEPVDVYRAGWLTVRRTYEPTADTNGGTYVGMLASGYRSFLDNRSKDPRRSKPKDVFYAVLKNHVLFLYESEEQAECWAAIEVSAHDVVIFPEGNVDGELFVKRTAIELKPRKVVEDEPGTPTGQPVAEGAAYDPQTGKPLPWFLFAKVNSDKEDWYHSLILASRLNSPSSATSLAADRALFSPEDMARLVESIDAQPDSIPMRWFNAFLGRVFLTAYRTSSLEDCLVSRLVRKLKRVKLPSLLSEVQVREVNVGSSVPLFSRPMLKELTSEGDASMEVHVSYIGAVRITISTVATFTLASRTYSVRLVLAVVLRELEGTLLVKMKTPPSNRIWFGFTKEPKMRIDVEPVVSARQIKWSLVTGPIESRIRELIIESLVLPHMDDLSFFDTRSQPLSRGGVYGPFLRKEREVDTPTPSNSNSTASGAKGEDVSEKPAGGDEEDLLDAGKEEREGTTPSVSTGGDDLRQRSTGMRRRRSSSEGGSTTPGGDLSRTGTTSSTATGGGKSSSVKTSSSVSSGLAAMSASIANWRENRAAAAAAANSSAASSPGLGPAEGAGTGVGGAAGGKRKTSWFTKSPSTSSASTPAASTPLAAPGARTPSAERGRAQEQKDEPPPLPTPKELKEKDEEALKRLNAVLGGGGKRAESKEREEVKAVAQEEAVGLTATPRPPLVQTKSNLSLTAPTLTKDDKPLPLNEPSSAPAPPPASSSPPPSAPLDVDTSPDHPPALPPRHLTDSPLPLNAPLSSAASTKSTRSTLSSSASTHETGESGEFATPTAATTVTEASGTAPPPPLPTRDRSPSLIKTLPVTPPSSSLNLHSATSSSPAPSTTSSSSLPPPPPPRRGHSPCPSLPHNTPSRPLSIPQAPASPSSPRQRVSSSSSSSHQNPPGSPTFHSSTSTTSSSPAGLLASWRSGNTNLRSVEGREEAKEALAQGVAQGVKEAKEKWGKWSAGWGKKNAPSTAAEDSSSSSATVTAPVTIPRPRTPDRPALPTRQARSSSLSLSSSPSGRGAAFSPAPRSPATASVSTVSASPASASHAHAHPHLPSSGSPSKPSYGGGYGAGGPGAGGGGGAAGGYKRASMMTLPGLAAQGVDRGKRERVKEDHLGVGVGVGMEVVPPPSGADLTKETAAAAPVTAAEVAGAADVSSSSPPKPTPQASAPAASSAPVSDVVGAASEVNEASAPAPASSTSPPTLPPRLPSSTVPAPSPGIAAEEALAPPLSVVDQSNAKEEEGKKKEEEEGEKVVE